MTDRGPATPGTAAPDLDKWDACPCGSPSGPKFRYGLCDPCAERTPASALLRMGQLFGNAALAASKSVPEIERLKAENASLRSVLESQHKEWLEEAGRLIQDKEAVEAENASLRESLRAAEKTSEKRLAELTKYYEAHGKECLRASAAEQRAADLTEALREMLGLPLRLPTHDSDVAILKRAHAALRAAGRGDEPQVSRPEAAPEAAWRTAIGWALGLESDPENHTPQWAADPVRSIREIGNAAVLVELRMSGTPEKHAQGHSAECGGQPAGAGCICGVGFDDEERSAPQAPPEFCCDIRAVYGRGVHRTGCPGAQGEEK